MCTCMHAHNYVRTRIHTWQHTYQGFIQDFSLGGGGGGGGERDFLYYVYLPTKKNYTQCFFIHMNILCH